VHEGIQRSQTASPRAADLPVRTNTQSPGAQRERMHQHTGSLGGTMAQFPIQPVHRQLSPNPPGGGGGSQDTTPSATPTPTLYNSPHHSMHRTVSPSLAVGPAHHASLVAQASSHNGGYSAYSGNQPTSPDVGNGSSSQVKVKVTCDSGAGCTLVVQSNISYQFLIDRIDAKLARYTSASLLRGSLRLQYQDEDGDYVKIESDEDIQIAFQEWRDMTRGLGPGDMSEIQLYCFGDIA
jgi:cell division control protein 24